MGGLEAHIELLFLSSKKEGSLIQAKGQLDARNGPPTHPDKKMNSWLIKINHGRPK